MILRYVHNLSFSENFFLRILYFKPVLGNIRIPVRGTGYHLGNVIYPITTDFSSILVERRN